jgi:hypothetical protein
LNGSGTSPFGEEAGVHIDRPFFGNTEERSLHNLSVRCDDKEIGLKGLEVSDKITARCFGGLVEWDGRMLCLEPFFDRAGHQFERAALRFVRACDDSYDLIGRGKKVL